VEDVCTSYRIKTPRMIVKESKKIALCVHSIGFIRKKNMLIITQGTLDSLKDNKISIKTIKFMILHEMSHIINDAKSLKVLQYLSQITLFGYSFLTMVVDFELLEEQADKFAIRHFSKDDTNIILSDLYYIHTYNFKKRMIASIQKHQKKSNIPNILNLYIEGYKKLYYIYFTRRIVTYTHLDDFYKRVKRMKEELNQYQTDSSCP
jgi:hypothetical protein